MTRQRLVWLAAALAFALFIGWIARNTYWEDVKIPMPLRGEALVNPFYAAQRFAGTLGARASWDRTLTLPPADGVIVLSGWHWSVARTRRAAIEQWVESGGRLVVDNMLMDPSGDFEHWSGIFEEFPEPDAKADTPPNPPVCRPLHEEARGVTGSTADIDQLSMCHIGISWLESSRAPDWTLRDKAHIQAARVRIGRGSVTVINAAPFRFRELFDGDHGRVLVAAIGLRPGDEVHFLSEDDYPSLLSLAWRYGAPVVAVGLVLVGLLLWRGAIRFGPLTPTPSSARRSLADQIRGIGRFALQHGDGTALHAACVRALEDSARRRISRYAALTPVERAAALADLTGFDRDALAAAIYHPRWRTAGELHRTLALLEATRRGTLTRHRTR